MPIIKHAFISLGPHFHTNLRILDVRVEENLVTLSGRFIQGQRELRVENMSNYRSKFASRG